MIARLQPAIARSLLFLFLVSATVARAHDGKEPIGEAIKSVPIFDAHVHYKRPAWGPFPPATVIELMDKSGVAMALVSSTPDVGTIRLWEYARRRIVPELRPYHDRAGSSNWTKAPGMLAYLRERLDKYPHEGIGGFHLFHVDPKDQALLKEVARMAKDRAIPIHIHSGAEPVRLLYEFEPSLTIIWAHAGMSEPPAVIEEMMARYATLYADTSYRERDILTGDDKIAPDWRRLIERFPERFMVGSDTWVNSQWQDYAELIALNRRWLSHFPRDIAEQIAFRNGERLFKRKVSRDLLGQK